MYKINPNGWNKLGFKKSMIILLIGIILLLTYHYIKSILIVL